MRHTRMENINIGSEKSCKPLNHFDDNSYTLWEREWEVPMTHARSRHSPCSCCWDGTPSPGPCWRTGPHIQVGGEDLGVLELDLMVVVEYVLCHWQAVRLSKLNKLAVFFYPGHCALDNSTNPKIITQKRCCTHLGSSHLGHPAQHEQQWRSSWEQANNFNVVPVQQPANTGEVHLDV